MKPARFLPLLALILATVACAWTDIAPPSAPVIEPSPLPTFAISTLTPVPTETPLPPLTSTPDVPVAWPKDLGVNCRYGPGKVWEAVSFLSPETMAEIKGRTVNTKWWYVSDPINPGGFCWVAYDVVETAGNLNIVPLAEEPTATVTDVTVDAIVTFIACGDKNPVTLSGTITSNGPTSATYHWEMSGDAQASSSDETIQFTEAGTQKVTGDFLSADCGNYIITLLITAPNNTSAEKLFRIQAP